MREAGLGDVCSVCYEVWNLAAMNAFVSDFSACSCVIAVLIRQAVKLEGRVSQPQQY